MSMVIVNQSQVPELLPMGECIQVMEEVLVGLARGECQLPLRNIMWLPDKRGALGMMPSHWNTAGVIGLKAVTFFPGNEGTELDSHQGAVMLFDADQGTLLAVIDGTSITALRTAAVSAVATKLLARDDSTHLAIIGSGVQASVHLQAMLQCRSIGRANLDGTDVGYMVEGLISPSGIALDTDGGKIYWTDIGSGKIQRANLDGSLVEDLVVDGVITPIDLALDVGGGKLYWTEASPADFMISRAKPGRYQCGRLGDWLVQP